MRAHINFTNLIMYKYVSVTIVLLLQFVYLSAVIGINWDHSVYLNDDYLLLWSTKEQEITFEVQVKTTGYFGLGFSKDGRRHGSDVVIGWVDNGQTYFHDRHIKKYGDGEPFVDPSQDYILLLGYENATHTVMRFKRKLDTCDTSHDIPITNDTIRIIYMYHEDDPRHGSIVPGDLPYPKLAFKGYKPLSLIQRLYDEPGNFSANKMQILDLRNQDVKLPQGDDSINWCKVFDLKQFKQKHHLIKFEPIFDSKENLNYLQHIMLYECQGGYSYKLEVMASEKGRQCQSQNMPCNAIVAAWYRGSEGLIFPQDVGFPIESSNERYYLMETMYNNPNSFKDIETLHLGPFVDNSGIRLYITENLRKYDAGVLSVGLDPNWRHIIPPGHEKVISEGHCIDDCTKKAFPPQGISIFAVIMQTHNIGKEVKLRQIRRQEELLSIVSDDNVHSQYSEYHRISPPAKILPGDRMIMECKYNSTMRSTITLGGITLREERCIALAIYYPRQKKLTTCHSLPSLATVLHSLGIEKLAMDSNPVLIAAPPELSGMSLETRLISYDWENEFDAFQKVTKSGTFRVLCADAKRVEMPGTSALEKISLLPIKYWRAILSNNCNSKITTQLYRIESADLTTLHDNKNMYVTEMVTQNKISDTSDVESLSLSSSYRLLSITNKFYIFYSIIIYIYYMVVWC